MIDDSSLKDINQTNRKVSHIAIVLGIKFGGKTGAEILDEIMCIVERDRRRIGYPSRSPARLDSTPT